MADGFRSFAELLLVRDVEVDVEAEAPHSRAATLRQAQGDTGEHECRCQCTAEAMREAKLFRASVVEGVESAIADLLGDIASDVLARELKLQPSDLRAIVDRALGRFAADEPLRVRIADHEPAIELAIPIIRDANLLPGDAIVEFRRGGVDARLGTRLASVLASQ